MIDIFADAEGLLMFEAQNLPEPIFSSMDRCTTPFQPYRADSRIKAGSPQRRIILTSAIILILPTIIIIIDMATSPQNPSYYGASFTIKTKKSTTGDPLTYFSSTRTEPLPPVQRREFQAEERFTSLPTVILFNIFSLLREDSVPAFALTCYAMYTLQRWFRAYAFMRDNAWPGRPPDIKEANDSPHTKDEWEMFERLMWAISVLGYTDPDEWDLWLDLKTHSLISREALGPAVSQF
ncbi:hypothetical protein EJ06DRAFT_528096 [Trichodelitschia bisporula]|uniref:F-box domain-containing protein n=1 Tax=Trichodelitschia bisporula TaxID=703511 RepID=A0A6G1I4N4_9PEZI|nr:hypothetical protein EJ06DRAFT_528096 [Trichodelitschia bisporula]